MKPNETKSGLSKMLKSIGHKLRMMLDIEKPELHRLFISELKTIYWAEIHLVDNLEKIASKATTAELQQTLLEHTTETQTHVHRLEEVFRKLGMPPATRICDSLVGLTTEMNKLIAETEDGTLIRDVAIISVCQKIEHYEIAAYGTLKTLAETLGQYHISGKLAETLQDEKNADVRLTYIAEGFVNNEATKE